MHIFESYELLFKYLFELYILTKLLIIKIIHECLDGTGTVSSNDKNNA